MMIREAIAKLVDGQPLAEEEAAAVMEEIMTGEATPAQLAASSSPCGSRARRWTRSPAWPASCGPRPCASPTRAVAAGHLRHRRRRQRQLQRLDSGGLRSGRRRAVVAKQAIAL